MSKWIISDTHFGHANIIRFTGLDGKLIRPRDDGKPFSCIEEHDELLIERWNADIAPRDDVYMLGDFGKPLEITGRLNGKKRLILGNHDDVHKIKDLGRAFHSVRSWRVFPSEFPVPVVFCHYPLHAAVDRPVPRRMCVHGHIHEKTILQADGRIDPWFINVSVEQTGLRPLSFEQLSTIITARGPLLTT